MQLENNTKVYLNRLIEFTSTLSFKYNHRYGNVIAEKSLVMLKDVYKITISTTCNGYDFVGFRTEMKKLIRDIEDQAEETQTEIYQIQKQLSRLLEDLFPVDTYNGTVTYQWEDHAQNDDKIHTLELCPPVEEEIRDYYLEIFDNLEGNDYLNTSIQEVVTSDPVDSYFDYIKYSISNLIASLGSLNSILTVDKNYELIQGKNISSKIKWLGADSSLAYLLILLEDEKLIELPTNKTTGKIDYPKVIDWMLDNFQFRKNVPSQQSLRKALQEIRVGKDSGKTITQIAREIKQKNIFLQ